MKKLTTSILVLAILICSQNAFAQVKLMNKVDSISYVIGMSMADNIKKTKEDFGDEVKFNLDAIKAGLQEGVDGKGRMDEAQIRTIMMAFQQDLQALSRKKSELEGGKNLAIGKAFLEANGKKAGVITTASGLQYKVTQEGTGASPTADDKVKVHYHGYLIDGSVFDSSVDRGEPIEFGLRGVIPGWTEGIPTMKVGGKTTFYIPSNLAYGPRGQGKIPANSVLMFDVELIEITTE